MRTEEATPAAVAPGERRRLLTARGPAIARECRIRWEGGDTLRLLVRYDGAESFAIDSPVHRFFGPFEGAGWMKEWSVGPMLNLTYLGRHGTKIDYEAELGGNGHAALARRFLESDRERTARCLLAHDDPIEVWVNRECVYRGESRFNGFEATWIELPLRQGRNEIVLRLTNVFNRNFNWSGFLFRPEL